MSSLLNQSLFWSTFGTELGPWVFEPFRAATEAAIHRQDTDDAVVFSLDLGELRRRHVSLDVEGRTVHVRGRRAKGWFNPEELTIERWFTLPDEVDPATLRASMRRGVLELTVDKYAWARARRIPVLSLDEPEPRAPEEPAWRRWWQSFVAALRGA